MQFDILTLFPDVIYNYTAESILGRAQKQKLISVKAHNFREYSTDKWGHVDDRPYGGGPGMILQVEPIYRCLKAIKALDAREAGKAYRPLKIKNSKLKIIVMDPAGKKFNQRMAEKFSKLDRLVIISGRYEGFDARVYKLADERVSIGDYVLAGGELPALIIIEAVARLIPGVLGNVESLASETHNVERIAHADDTTGSALRVMRSTREHPQYTRPENFMGLKVPKVLLSGDHKKIVEWRRKKSR